MQGIEFSDRWVGEGGVALYLLDNMDHPGVYVDQTKIWQLHF